MPKPTFASVTEIACKCNYLQDAADEPGNPITFDAETGEYQFSYADAMLVVYHCPFCGGAAPESKRDLLFAQIDEEEVARLAQLLNGIETINDAVEKLGSPDFEGTSQSREPASDNAAPTIQQHKNIRYHNLSDVAEVWIKERPDGKVSWALQGKYLG